MTLTPDSQEERAEWKPCLPPGEYYDGMVDDFEVYFSPGGQIWHRAKLKEVQS